MTTVKLDLIQAGYKGM